MPRRREAPRLCLDRSRQQWFIRDGARFIRTGCAEVDRDRAEARLAQYLGEKHQPQITAQPLIADILLIYGREHLPHTLAAKKTSYNLASLAKWWGDKRLVDVTARNCRAYAEGRTAWAARRDLEVLRAAIHYYHGEYGPLPSLPKVKLPPKGGRRERWLTRSEAARFLKAARHVPYLARFFLIGIHTGTRSGAILALQWDWIDLASGVMARRAPGTVGASNKRSPPVRLGKSLLAHLRRWKRLDQDPAAPRCASHRYAAPRNATPCHVVHRNGERLFELRRVWQTARIKAGLDTAVTPHVLRHTRATWMMQAGVPLWEAAGHLGMTASILETIYGKHSPEFQKRAAEV